MVPTVAEATKRWFDAEAATGRWDGSPDVWRSLERDALPVLGVHRVNAVTAPMLVRVLDAVIERGAHETAHRLAERLGWFFAYASSPGRGWMERERNPALSLKEALPKRPKQEHFPSVLDLVDARAVLHAVASAVAFPTTKLAHGFHALCAARPHMTREARWEQMIGLDGGQPLWRLSASDMKSEQALDIPLSRQAVEVLEAVRTLSGSSPHVFPSAIRHHAPMSDGALGGLLNDAGFDGQHVPHGWRSTFSTIMNGRHPKLRPVIEVRLAHTDENAKGKVGAAYNRATYIATRRELLQEWADDLLEGAWPASALPTGPKRRVGRYAVDRASGAAPARPRGARSVLASRWAPTAAPEPRAARSRPSTRGPATTSRPRGSTIDRKRRVRAVPDAGNDPPASGGRPPRATASSSRTRL